MGDISNVHQLRKRMKQYRTPALVASALLVITVGAMFAVTAVILRALIGIPLGAYLNFGTVMPGTVNFNITGPAVSLSSVPSNEPDIVFQITMPQIGYSPGYSNVPLAVFGDRKNSSVVDCPFTINGNLLLNSATYDLVNRTDFLFMPYATIRTPGVYMTADPDLDPTCAVTASTTMPNLAGIVGLETLFSMTSIVSLLYRYPGINAAQDLDAVTLGGADSAMFINTIDVRHALSCVNYDQSPSTCEVVNATLFNVTTPVRVVMGSSLLELPTNGTFYNAFLSSASNATLALLEALMHPVTGISVVNDYMNTAPGTILTSVQLFNGPITPSASHRVLNANITIEQTWCCKLNTNPKVPLIRWCTQCTLPRVGSALLQVAAVFNRTDSANVQLYVGAPVVRIVYNSLAVNIIWAILVLLAILWTGRQTFDIEWFRDYGATTDQPELVDLNAWSNMPVFVFDIVLESVICAYSLLAAIVVYYIDLAPRVLYYLDAIIADPSSAVAGASEVAVVMCAFGAALYGALWLVYVLRAYYVTYQVGVAIRRFAVLICMEHAFWCCTTNQNDNILFGITNFFMGIMYIGISSTEVWNACVGLYNNGVTSALRIALIVLLLAIWVGDAAWVSVFSVSEILFDFFVLMRTITVYMILLVILLAIIAVPYMMFTQPVFVLDKFRDE